MGRATLGGLVIAMAAVLAVLASAASHRVTAGHAYPAAPPRAPKVGDCLLSPPAAIDLSGLPSAPMTVLAGCDGPRYGEVVEVGVAPETEWLLCSSASRTYVGLPATVADGPWTALPPLQVRVISPSPDQEAAGQRWAACVAYADDATFPLTLAHLLDQWISASPLSQCDFDPGVTELRDAQCSAPHRTEVLGTAEVIAPLPDLDSSCRALAAAATRMPDPTAGGALRITATITHDAAPGASTAGLSSAGEGTATCAIATTGGRTLTGSLLGLGTHPVPWT